MEYCEFFFDNFWHWLGGLIYLLAIFSTPLVCIGRGKSKTENDSQSN